MKLVPLGQETLINPEHVSHITVRIEPSPTKGRENNRGHDYPVYRITMYNGTWYDIECKHDYVQAGENGMFEPLRYILQSLGAM